MPPYLPESLILPLISENRLAQRSECCYLRAVYESEIKVGWESVKNYGGVRKSAPLRLLSDTAYRCHIDCLHYRGKAISFVIITQFVFLYFFKSVFKSDWLGHPGVPWPTVAIIHTKKSLKCHPCFSWNWRKQSEVTFLMCPKHC